jgi:uncharacterized membrane protein
MAEQSTKEKTIEHLLHKAKREMKKAKEQEAKNTELDKFTKKLHPVETLTKIIIFLAIIGVFVAIYLTYLHFRNGGTSFCNINERFNCDVVNRSPYSVFMGIPVAIIGFLGYIAFIVIGVAFLLGYDWSKLHPKLRPKHLNWLILAMAAIGTLFSLHLAYIEEFVLHTWCIMCVASLLIIISILVLSIISYRYCRRCKDQLHKVGMKAGDACRYC